MSDDRMELIHQQLEGLRLEICQAKAKVFQAEEVYYQKLHELLPVDSCFEIETPAGLVKVRLISWHGGRYRGMNIETGKPVFNDYYRVNCLKCNNQICREDEQGQGQ